MLKVVIADDEQLICSLLQKLILWDEIELELVGVVHNGKDLLTLIKDKHPDIVVTDICMPEMDGIELIRQVRQEGIPCRFIIISGYRQFEYAHNALKYDVEDYLLKPIDADELNEALKKIVNSILYVKRNEEALIQRTDSDTMKRFFLHKGMTDIAKVHSFEEIQMEYGIEFKEGLFQVVHIKLDALDKSEELADDANSIQRKLAEVVKKVLSPYYYEILIDMQNNEVEIALNYNSLQEVNIKSGIQEYFDIAKNIVDLFIGLKITIGVGNAYTTLQELQFSREEAEAAVWSRIVKGVDKILYCEKPENDIKNMVISVKDTMLRRIKKSFEILDIADFTQSMQEIFSVFRENFIPIEVTDFLQRVVDLFFEIDGEILQGCVSEDYLRKQVIYNSRNAISVKDLREAVVNPIIDSMEQLIIRVNKQNAKPVRKAVDFIENNFQKPLRLEDVATQVNLNPVYFSKVFKKETGENFVDYLTNYRMDEAKRLLKNSNKNVNEIARAIGYADPRYFSKLFKKIIGVKPTEYRKIYG